MTLLDQYSERFGAPALWSQTIRSDAEDELTVARFRPARGVRLHEGSEVFVTAGMSARAMTVPRPDVPDRIELICAVPETWAQVWEVREPEFVVVETLRLLAAYPFAAKTFLGNGHTIPGGRRLSPKTDLCGWLITGPLVLHGAAPLLTASGPAALLLATPLHLTELTLARAKGTSALMQGLITLVERRGQDWAWLTSPARPPVQGGPGGAAAA